MMALVSGCFCAGIHPPGQRLGLHLDKTSQLKRLRSLCRWTRRRLVSCGAARKTEAREAEPRSTSPTFGNNCDSWDGIFLHIQVTETPRPRHLEWLALGVPNLHIQISSAGRGAGWLCFWLFSGCCIRDYPCSADP